MIHVSAHAIERYQERVANLPQAEVVRILSSPFIEAAAAFGAPYVRLPSGHRVALARSSVVTVLPNVRCKKALGRHSRV